MDRYCRKIDVSPEVKQARNLRHLDNIELESGSFLGPCIASATQIGDTQKEPHLTCGWLLATVTGSSLS